MNYNCIICFGSLLSDTSNSAVIPCGHVFHKNCIRPWIDQSKKCPLCKKSTSHRQIISPLYFSTTEDTEVVDDPSSSNTKTRDLQLKINTLTNEYNSCNKDRQSLRKDLANANLKIEQMQHELKSTTKAMRYLKQVRRVADIDDYLASPTAKAYLRSLQNMSNDDLLVAFGSLTARFTASNKERDEALKRATISEKAMSSIKAKNERLKQQLKAKQSGLDEQPTRRPKRKFSNVIVLDSEEDEDEEEEEKSDSSIELRPVEEVTENVETEQGNNTEDTQRNISLLQGIAREFLSDGEEEYAVEEHTSPMNSRFNFKRYNNHYLQAAGQSPKRLKTTDEL